MAVAGEELSLKVLSWNIDGLNDEQFLEMRTNVVMDIIQNRSPHIVYLQEVVSESLDIMQARLGSVYSIHTNGETPSATYFPAILVTKTCPKITLDGKVRVHDFQGSTMGRRLLKLFVKICGVPVALYTTHLESLSDFSRQRKRQLKMCFESVHEQSVVFKRNCIFGGDLNITDSEIDEVGVPESCVDIWEGCGSIEEHRYTRDSIINDNGSRRFQKRGRARIDRIYLSSPELKQCLKLVSFELVGKEKIPACKCYPSDHWGIYAVFDVV